MQSVQRGVVFCGDPFHPPEMILEGLEAAGAGIIHFEPARGLIDGLIMPDTSVVVIAKLNVTSPTDPQPWANEVIDRQLREFVEAGNSLLVVHGGTVRYSSAPSIRMMTGGAFVQHPASCEVTLQVLRDHFLTAGVESFAVKDEHYFLDVDADLDVFLLAQSVHGTQPAGWTKIVGKGRVCVIAPGHGAEVWQRREYRQLLRNALQWLTHGER